MVDAAGRAEDGELPHEVGAAGGARVGAGGVRGQDSWESAAGLPCDQAPAFAASQAYADAAAVRWPPAASATTASAVVP